jgi:hypothetical protein
MLDYENSTCYDIAIGRGISLPITNGGHHGKGT